MRSPYAVVMGAIDLSRAAAGCVALVTRLRLHRGRLALLSILVLPLLVAACGGKGGGHGGSWG